MNRKINFSEGEWYHCFARGVDKRKIYETTVDYDRFVMLLYSSNSDIPVHISNLGSRHQGPTLMTVLEQKRGTPLVDIGAYCLMPNHYHLLLRQRAPGGITRFMRKLGTGYTMYFNIKNERVGVLFSGIFHASHVHDDRYLKRVINYIHANIAELLEPKWKEGVIKNQKRLENFFTSYRYSSLLDYNGNKRKESVLLAREELLDLFEDIPNLQALLKDARDFIKVGP